MAGYDNDHDQGFDESGSSGGLSGAGFDTEFDRGFDEAGESGESGSGANHGGHGYGDGLDGTPLSQYVAGAGPATATVSVTPAAVSGSNIRVGAETVTATVAATQAGVAGSDTVTAGTTPATAPSLSAGVATGIIDSAGGPTAEAAPRSSNDRWIVQDTATSVAAETVVHPTPDSLTIIDDTADGAALETLPEIATGRIRAPIVSTVEPPSDDSPRERIEGYLKTPFKTPVENRGTREEGDFGKLMALLSNAAEDHASVRDQMVYSRYVDTAIGDSLDNIGASVLVNRVRNADGTLESDEHYRVRIKAQRRALMGGGLLIQIRRGVASLLDVAPGSVRIFENFAREKAAFQIVLTQRMLDESDTPLEYVVDFVDLIRAGGVKANLTLDGEFRHRHYLADPNERHGYNTAPYTADLHDLV